MNYLDIFRAQPNLSSWSEFLKTQKKNWKVDNFTLFQETTPRRFRDISFYPFLSSIPSTSYKDIFLSSPLTHFFSDKTVLFLVRFWKKEKVFLFLIENHHILEKNSNFLFFQSGNLIYFDGGISFNYERSFIEFLSSSLFPSGLDILVADSKTKFEKKKFFFIFFPFQFF